MNFSPLVVPLQGRHLIEASAGTGKTYNIVRLYVRLVLELEGKLERILVVTFTEAATAELVTRVRQALVDALSVLEGVHEDREWLDFFANRDHPDVDRKILKSAVPGFDRARISTIHHFCSASLREFAVYSGRSFDQELVTSQHEWIVELADDFKVRFCYSLDPLTVRSVNTFSRADMVRAIDLAASDPSLELGFDHRGKCEPLGALARSLFDLWTRDGATVIELLTKAKVHHSRRRAFQRHFDRMVNQRDIDNAIMNNMDLLIQESRSSQLDLPFATAVEHWLQSRSTWRRAFVAELVAEARSLLQARKERARVYSHDDVLTQFESALNGDQGEALCQLIRASTPVALVDEFQDTDPIQARVFNRLYGSTGTLFLIGDPKQSIYGFRRADVFEYLRAKRVAGTTVHRLSHNWRSSVQLIEAVNAFFSAVDHPFVEPDIIFHPALPGSQQRPPITLNGQSVKPCQLTLVPRASKAVLEKKVCTRLAHDVARFLSAQPTVGDTRLKAREVVILVNTHAQAAAVTEAMAELGIHSSYQGARNVFSSEEAEELAVLLEAVLHPNDAQLIRRALLTSALGYNANDLELLDQDLPAWTDWLMRFRMLRETWVQRGFPRMFRLLMSTCEVEPRLLALSGGERRTTNFLHLGERLGEVAHRQHLGPAALMRWFARREESKDLEDEIRLETDAHAVQVMTIFASKGLEFPAVFCPFAWAPSPRHKSVLQAVHEPSGVRKLHLSEGQDWQRVKSRALEESRAEEMRLLYVAMTRAQDYLHLYVGAEGLKGGLSAANALFLRQSDWVYLEQPQIDFSAWGSALEFWNSSSQHVEAGSFRDCDDGFVDNEGLQPMTLRVSQRNRVLPIPLRQTSFTMMTAHSSSLDVRGWVDDEPEIGPYDGSEVAVHLHELPRGARSGNFLHRVLELIDFERPVVEFESTIQDSLIRFGYPQEWVSFVAPALQSVLTTPLEGEMCLRSVAAGQRLSEWEFTMPLGLDRPNWNSNSLAQVFGIAGGSLPASYSREIERLQLKNLSGYLKGFVDLVFCHGGRWFVVDYKSNDLGANLSDYADQSLANEMQKHHYFLQYHLYCAALHRFLTATLTNYDYERHFGGVFYLFLRGMMGNSQRGVYRDRPPRRRLEGLLELMGES